MEPLSWALLFSGIAVWAVVVWGGDFRFQTKLRVKQELQLPCSVEFDVPVPEHLEVAICEICFPFSSGVLKGKIELSRASDVLAGVLLAERPENKGIPLFWNHDFLVQPRCLELPVYACFKGGVITIRCNLECNVKRGWLKLRLGVRDRVKFKCAFKTKRHWS